ncbi:MAG: methyltransferase [Bacteroidia bacterium]|nr:MAG: methyltransferase [Bacteroidia bacterium]
MNFICPICNSNKYKPFINCVDYTTTKEQFNLVSCENCGLVQTFPYPDQKNIGKYYESNEYISHSDKKNSFFDILYHVVRKYTLIQKVNLIKNYVPHGTILDYGCGTGYFLEACNKNKFTTYGIEINEKAREIARSKNQNIFKDIKEIKDVKFDIITLWHVLEHLYEPKEYINTFYNLLNKNGYLLLALPNKNSYDGQYYKNYWAGYDVPRHLFHFTKKDIQNLISKKFKIIDIHPMYFDSFYVSILSEKYKKTNLALLKGIYRGFISNLKANKSKEYSSLIYVLQKI